MGIGSWEAETGFSFFDIQVCILFLCIVYAVPFSCFRSIYIRLYFTFLTLRWIDDEDGLSADTAAAHVAITLGTSGMYSMWGVSFTTPGLRKVFARHEMHEIRGAFSLRKI